MSEEKCKLKENDPKNNQANLVKNTANVYNSISFLIAVLAIGIVLIMYADECKKCFSKENNGKMEISKTPIENVVFSQPQRKTFWAYGKNIETGYLRHVFQVLDRIGYENLGENTSSTNWDLLWAHDYPFTVLYSKLKNLQSHQRVNHFPGCGYVTNKVSLATSNLEYIPPAFRLPEDKEKLLKYSKENPQKKFVSKHNEHRHVHVKTIAEMDLDKNGSFAQVFIDNPLLVEGHMFDIGIYTIITSIDPLRIYIYYGDFLLRFCPEIYHPFDPKILDKYIVGDDYLPIWEVPVINYYYNELGFGMRDSLTAYLKTKNKDAQIIWKQIEESISLVFLNKKDLILNVVKRFKSKRNFFEMMRFDFIVDDTLKLHLLEANMSPNLSSAHFKPNQLLYEQVIFNMLGLVGIGEKLHRHSLKIRSKSEELMQTADKNLAVHPEICTTKECKEDCSLMECSLCKTCWDEELKNDFVSAHREYLNRGDCKRIFPPSMIHGDKNRAENFENYSENDKLMYLWFEGKCQLDSTWCA